MSDRAKTAEEYLKAPYSRVLIPDAVTGTFTARILEFTGCVSQGDTAEEALARLEDAAASWLVASLDSGQPIPSPIEEREFNGRVLLRLPKSHHRAAVDRAEQEGVSLNQFLVAAVSEKLGFVNGIEAALRELERRNEALPKVDARRSLSRGG